MSRVLLITQSFPNEKSETGRYAQSLAYALTGQGHEIHVVTSARSDIVPTSPRLHIHKIFETWRVFEFGRFVKLFLEVRPDIIHYIYSPEYNNFGLASMLSEMNKHLWKVPFVTTVFNFQSASLAQKMKSWPIFFSSSAITVSQEAVKRSVTRILAGQKEEKVHVIGHVTDFTIDPSPKTQHQREKWDLEKTDFMIGFKTQSPSKNALKFFLKTALPLLKKERSLKIVIFNSSVEFSPITRNEILSLVENQGVMPQVIFAGENLLNLCDVFVFLSERPVEEDFPPVLRDAMTAGLPSLTWSKTPFYCEFGLKHGENIWLTDFKSPQALRNDLKTLCENQELRTNLSEGAQSLKSQFGYDHLTNALSRIYSGQNLI